MAEDINSVEKQCSESRGSYGKKEKPGIRKLFRHGNKDSAKYIYINRKTALYLLNQFSLVIVWSRIKLMNDGEDRKESDNDGIHMYCTYIFMHLIVTVVD